jgi:hypothetical protein
MCINRAHHEHGPPGIEGMYARYSGSKRFQNRYCKLLRSGHAMTNSDTSLQIMTHLGNSRDASMVSCGR